MNEVQIREMINQLPQIPAVVQVIEQYNLIYSKIGTISNREIAKEAYVIVNYKFLEALRRM